MVLKSTHTETQLISNRVTLATARDIIFPENTMDVTRWTELRRLSDTDYHPHRTDGPLPCPWTINAIGLRRLYNGQIDDEAVNHYL